jgi:hypothetical protein
MKIGTRTRALFAGLAVAAVIAAAVAEGSGSDPQANHPQIAGDASSDTNARFPTNKQNEPTIAVNPTDASKLISGSNDEQLQPPCGPGTVRGAAAAANDCSFFPDVGTSGVYTSGDGGTSWTNGGLLPGYSDDDGALVSDGDPVIVYGPKPEAGGGFSYAHGARAYYADLASFASGAANGNQAPELIAVSTSDDDGAHWSDPSVAARAGGHVFNDKESIWADNNPASPHFGRVYVSWSQFRSIPGTNVAIRVVFSADGGKTWSVPRQVSAAYNNLRRGGRQFSALRTAADGTVYVAWIDGDAKVGSKQLISTSRDGGSSWSRPAIIGLVEDQSDPIPGSNFRTGSYPSIAVDQTSGAVYASWSNEMTTANGSIVFTRSTDQGKTWSAPVAVSAPADGYAFFQGLDVAPNRRIDIAYQAQKAKDEKTYGTGNATIDSYYVNSTDGGITWSAPRKISTASSDPAASAQNNLARQFWGDYNTLVSTNTFAWFIFTDTRDGVGCPAVDAYQHALATVAKPAPPAVCPDQFGNSDVHTAKITP